MFERMIEGAPIGFCSLSLDRRILRVNPKFCEMFGYSKVELSQMHFSDLTSDDDHYEDEKAFKDLLCGKLSAYRVEKQCVTKDGRIFWIDLTSSLFWGNEDQPMAFVCLMQDITRRKQAEERLSASEARFRTLFEQAPFSVQLLALNGSTLQVNSAWEALWNSPKEVTENYVLKKYNVLTDPQLAAKGITPYIKAAYAGESVVTKPVYYDPNENGQPGRPRWLLAYCHPIKDENGEVVEVMLIHHDVTSQVKVEKELKHAKEAAESANRLKSAFLANMSHEIRTPLAAIIGFTELLQDKDLSELERNEYLEIIKRSGRSLTQIINDILDLSRIEAGNMRVDKAVVRAQDIIDEVLDLLKLEAQNKGLFLSMQLEPHAPKLVNTDPIRMRQILLNLVGNAIKFTQKGGVTVILSARGDQLAISVRDTGIGIPRKKHRYLFKPFSQIDSSSTRNFHGTGLGLALSRRLANALGGDIWLSESQVGAGSTFVCVFPGLPKENEVRVAAETSEARLVNEEVATLAGLKVLIVDDSAENRFLIERVLIKKEATIDCATSGKEALKKVAGDDFDLILMDVQMPEMDGLEATRQLRRKGYKKPIIALTAHAMKEDVQRSLDAGCNAHLSKPVYPQSLLKVIVEQTVGGPPKMAQTALNGASQ